MAAAHHARRSSRRHRRCAADPRPRRTGAAQISEQVLVEVFAGVWPRDGALLAVAPVSAGADAGEFHLAADGPRSAGAQSRQVAGLVHLPRTLSQPQALRSDVLKHRVEEIMSKGRVLGEFFQFLKQEKKYWLVPIVIVFVLFGLLIVFSQSSAVAPFIYTLF